MDRPLPTGPAEGLKEPNTLTASKIVEVLWETAVGAFVKTILVIVFGSIVVNLVGGLWQQMTPSPPPGFAPAPLAEAETPARSKVWVVPFKEHQFLFVFGLVFVVTAWVRLKQLSNTEKRVAVASRMQKIGRRLSEQWFGLVVGNAFGAMISAMVLVWVQRFSLTRLLYHWLIASVLSEFQTWTSHLLGSNRFGSIQAWFAWYGANQFKFTFWLLYLAAICDDLGIPNLKTFCRWLWRRNRRKRFNQPALLQNEENLTGLPK